MILLTGPSGQVGSAFLKLLPTGDVLPISRADLDLSRPDEIPERLNRIVADLPPSQKIRAFIHPAAYTAVDQAETDRDVARRVNAEAPGAIARWCAGRGIPMIHFSTDYVFDGSGTHPWKESDPTGPVSIYGRTKQEGEEQVQAAGGKHLIFRTSWVYAPKGKNFVLTMLKLGVERDSLRVVADQIGAPTYAPDIARAALDALTAAEAKPTFPTGVYHLCNSGETSWHGFATRIFDLARSAGFPLRVQSVDPISTADFPTPARRPSNSRMDCSLLERTFDVRLRPWDSALSECLQEIQKGHSSS